MKRTIVPVLLIALVFAACNGSHTSTATGNDSAAVSSATTVADPAKDWKFGVALWTFHTMSFPEMLDKVDSAGLTYIEPSTTHKAGKELKDSILSTLSTDGIEKLKALIAKKNLKVGSIYIGGDSTIASWKREFDIAKQFDVKIVTAEPPLNMWDAIDSLAGVYGMKVAIHEHWKGVSRYWHPDSVLAAIKGHSNFGACPDLGHWPKSGIDPVEGVKKLSGHILVMHFKDIAAFNDPKLRDVPAGTGVVNFPAVLAELKKQNFKGYIYIERDAEDQPSNLPSVINTVKYYNDIVGKLK